MSTENQSDLDVAKLIISQKQKSDFDIVLAFNYYPENLKCGNDYSNKFEECFIYALDEYGKEKYTIVE